LAKIEIKIEKILPSNSLPLPFVCFRAFFS
jgi:hypothetical protein